MELEAHYGLGVAVMVALNPTVATVLRRTESGREVNGEVE
jgi:hypothetical protein